MRLQANAYLSPATPKRASGQCDGVTLSYQRGRYLHLVLAHELGHHALGHTKAGSAYTRGLLSVVRCEEEAWKWAIARRPTPLTRGEVAFIRRCLGTYYAAL